MQVFRILLILLINSIWSNIFSQALVLEIPLIKTSEDSIFFDLKIENKGTNSITFYIPDEEDVCKNIIKFKVRNTISNEEFLFFPCEYIADLDSVTLSWNNSTIIHKDDCYRFKLCFPKANFLSLLDSRNKFILSVDLDYDFNFNFKEYNLESIPIFKKTLSASRYF